MVLPAAMISIVSEADTVTFHFQLSIFNLYMKGSNYYDRMSLERYQEVRRSAARH